MRLSIRRVLARSADAVRRRWLTLVLLTYGFGFLPRLALTLWIRPQVRGDADVAGLAMSFLLTVAIALCVHFARATVTGAVVRPREGPLSAVAATLTALPALAPMWFASEYYTFWTYLNFWMFHPLVGHPTIVDVEARVLLPLLVMLVVALASAATLGVLTPVVIAERLSLPNALARCWALMRGNRWRALALYVLVSAALILLTLPGTWLRQAARSADPSHIYVTLKWVESAVFEAFDAMLAVVLASAYLELVQNERGVLDGEVAQVFD